MRKSLFRNKFIVFLYMFRALLCSLSEVLAQPVHRTATYTVWRYQMLYNTIFTSWWWTKQCSKHVQAYNKNYKTTVCALSWLINKTNVARQCQLHIIRCSTDQVQFISLIALPCSSEYKQTHLTNAGNYVIITTGYKDPDRGRGSPSLPLNGCLLKPFQCRDQE